ncbi:hypothetical protein D3C80_1844610 [compost metagenome]
MLIRVITEIGQKIFLLGRWNRRQQSHPLGPEALEFRQLFTKACGHLTGVRIHLAKPGFGIAAFGEFVRGVEPLGKRCEDGMIVSRFAGRSQNRVRGRDEPVPRR